jgi:hypothetical protein
VHVSSPIFFSTLHFSHCISGILKLGLCGWLRDDHPATLLAGGIRLDTVELVERVIGIARRRRSIKAVETYEQVQFLVDFVEYLRAKRAADGA